MENYEQKYKETLSFLKDLKPYMSDYCIEKLEGFFSELKESEDERIRKEILKYLEERKILELEVEPYHINEWIAWLEKQDEKLHVDWNEKIKGLNKLETYILSLDPNRSLDAVKVDAKNIRFLVNDGQQPKTTPQWMIDFLDDYRRKIGCSMDYDEIRDIDGKILAIVNWMKGNPNIQQQPTPKFKIRDTIHKIGENTVFPLTIEKIEDGDYVCNNSHSFVNIKFQDDYELVEQNNSWSEEDEEMLERCIDTMSMTAPNLLKKEIDWLKSLKDRVQPQQKQEWSEEDEKRLLQAITALEGEGEKYLKDYGEARYKDIVTWLKSIKPNHWKPSEQNIKDLEWCADLVKDKMGVGFHRLQVFIDEIKKL